MKKVLLAVFILCAASLPSLAAAPVTLRHAVELNRAAIRLSDVFDGLEADKDREIAVSPAPGKSVTYNLHVLTKLAEQYHLDWKPSSLADQTVLTRASTLVSQDMIQDVVMARVKDTLGPSKDGAEVVFDNRNLALHLPASRTPDFALVNFTYDEQSRRFRGELVAQTDAQPITQPVSGRVILKKSVPVLSRRLAAGTTIGESDLKWITVNVDQLGVDVVTDASQIVGRELRHDQPENDLFRSRDVTLPRLVTRGSIVMMKVETPLMLITTQGRALQDGAKGEVVRVTNMQSNKIIEGTVEAGGIVRVGTLRKMASAE